MEGLARKVGIYLGGGNCAVAQLRAGRVWQLGGDNSDSGDIKRLDWKSYRYLGVEQVCRPQSRETKDRAANLVALLVLFWDPLILETHMLRELLVMLIHLASYM